jgi:hypothetical protein
MIILLHRNDDCYLQRMANILLHRNIRVLLDTKKYRADHFRWPALLVNNLEWH